MQANIKSRFSSGRSIELIPSGIPSLDTTLGGGYPLGSIVLISEDDLGAYSDLFFKAYFSQGLVNDDTVFLASTDGRTASFFDSLPDVQDGLPSDDSIRNEPMTIAWRYGSSTTSIRESPKQLSLSNNFTFGKRIPADRLKGKCILEWYPGESPNPSSTFDDLLKCIKEHAVDHLAKVQKSGKKSHLRIGLHHLGSALWLESQEQVPSLLFKLRCLIAHYPASVVVTLPPDVFKNPKIVSRCHQLSDIVFGLEAIDAAADPMYSEYNGLIQLIKISPINSLTPLAEITDDWAFKLLKKRLLVERLTLPPELDTSTQREQTKDVPLCGSLQKTLDF